MIESHGDKWGQLSTCLTSLNFFKIFFLIQQKILIFVIKFLISPDLLEIIYKI